MKLSLFQRAVDVVASVPIACGLFTVVVSLPGGAAAAWHGASALLARLAARVRATHAAEPAEPVVEFHAEAGTRNGVLYVDGLRIGVLLGVTRL